MKGRVLALGAMLVLGGCVVQPQQPEQPPQQTSPPAHPTTPTPPPKQSSSPITPQPSSAPAAKRPTQFAPPPGGKGRWDASLGVYVIQGQKDLYYRQRTYYHWDNGWYWGVGPQGPWTETDSSGVPPGLTRKYAQ
ncbi:MULTISPECIES: hypothetical protein [Pseudomonas]|uniref:Lipoprotein n=1 Tax=Pseudomonas nitroreducens TaxID=46680 RepID=A0ABS0KEJ1_PSENT|nr:MULTISPECIES: hypothetical protein [Pseudomonas]MBG6286021.1 hypothetical protein [Pseudomonas nitroreducens]MDG9856517.1 hypothetical protein [Pseudomonas nitroreducens]MDH1075883.1 hypothetical protein [Pseudomonas nitroreducens]NMZ57788.1 hypothetical protein [Pseudomonas nitroreducens]NMZ76494.1 hypothetical protein [Pseudomonas nitroreducens]